MDEVTALQMMRTDRELVDGLRDSDPSAAEELISRYSERLRALLRRWKVADEDMGEVMGDMIVTVIDRARSRGFGDPDALSAFFWAVARRRVALYRSQAAGRPAAPTRIAVAVLTSMPERDREALVRYYLGEQNPEQICRTFQLTPEQWQLMKSRAKGLFGLGGRKSMGRLPVTPLATGDRFVA